MRKTCAARGESKVARRRVDVMHQPTFDDYTFWNRWGLTCIAIWRNERRDRSTINRFLDRLHVIAIFFLLTMLMIPQWLDLYMLWGHFDANVETVVVNVFTVCALLKFCCFLSSRDIFKDVVGTMRSNWNESVNDSGPNGEVHRRVLLETAAKARSYTKRYGILMYSTATIYFVSPFVGLQKDTLRIRKYPFYGWYYFDRFSDLCYGICYLSQLFSGLVVGTTNYSTDSFFLSAIYHTCAQLRILQHDLGELGQRGNSSSERIVELVRKHQRVIRDAKKLERLFRNASFQQLMVSSTILCIIGFKIIMALNDGSAEFFIYFSFMFVALLQIYLYCRPGEELILQSTKVGTAVYQSFWNNLQPESVRKISMIILRSQTPLKMTAGTIYILSLPNFTRILKTSMSLMSVLRATY